MIASNIICPFCGEDGFDLIGLKHHLENYCESYKSTLSIDEEKQIRKLKRFKDSL